MLLERQTGFQKDQKLVYSDALVLEVQIIGSHPNVGLDTFRNVWQDLNIHLEWNY
jgi:hypothetical protein